MSKRTNRWLGAALLLLIGLGAGLLLLLRGDGNGDGGAEVPAPRAVLAPPPPRPQNPPPRAAPAPERPTRSVRRGVEPAAPDAGTPREPLGVHSAPAAVPVEIAVEKDPVKQARLLRMHALAVARSRASRLRRRVRLLETTLSRGRTEGKWSEEQIQRTHNQVRELKRAVETAEAEVERAEERVKQDR